MGTRVGEDVGDAVGLVVGALVLVGTGASVAVDDSIFSDRTSSSSVWSVLSASC